MFKVGQTHVHKFIIKRPSTLFVDLTKYFGMFATSNLFSAQLFILHLLIEPHN